MAIQTLRSQVRTRQVEIGGVVIKNMIAIARGVTGKTSIALIYIPTYSIVFIVCFRVGMAGGTGEFSVIRRIGMTICTLTPLAVVCAAVYREILSIVIKSRRHPRSLTMTGSAICRKLQGYVIGVRCCIVIIGMAAKTGIGGIVIIPVVAGRTIIRNGSMRSV